MVVGKFQRLLSSILLFSGLSLLLGGQVLAGPIPLNGVSGSQRAFGGRDLISPFYGDLTELRRLLQSVPSGGIYVGVNGGDKSFVTLGLGATDQASHKFGRGIFLEARTNSLQYAKTNIRLLKLSHSSREKYRHLRLEASETEWEQLLIQDHQAYEALPLEFERWVRHVRHDLHFQNFRKNKELFLASYVNSPLAFDQLAQLAEADNMQAVGIDLADPKSVDEFVRDLNESGEKITVLDLGGAYHRDQVPQWKGSLTHGLLTVYNQFKTVLHPEARIFFLVSRPIVSRSSVVTGPAWSHTYVGATAQELSAIMKGNFSHPWLVSMEKIEPGSIATAKAFSAVNMKNDFANTLGRISLEKARFFKSLCDSLLRKGR